MMHNPIFNPADIDHNMHDRLISAVMDGMDVHDMKVDGDGEQSEDIRFLKCKVDAVLWKLLADECFEGCHLFQLKKYKMAKGDRILGGHANGSDSFQISQARVGPGIVPISIVLYIDATFLKRWIPIRSIYGKVLYMISYFI
jgi:hypothetical protein